MKQIFIKMALVTALVIPKLSYADQLPVVTPDKDTIAIVLGTKIEIKDKDKLVGLIVGKLFEQYATENKLEPTEAEIAAFSKASDKQRVESQKQRQADQAKNKATLLEELKSKTLTEAERKMKESMLQALEESIKLDKQVTEEMQSMSRDDRQKLDRETAPMIIKPWKLNKSLYEQYGGHIRFQQFGLEAAGAYRAFLEEQESKGAFKIINKDDEVSFWKNFRNGMQPLSQQEKEENAKLILKENPWKTPWWLSDKPMETK